MTCFSPQRAPVCCQFCQCVGRDVVSISERKDANTLRLQDIKRNSRQPPLLYWHEPWRKAAPSAVFASLLLFPSACEPARRRSHNNSERRCYASEISVRSSQNFVLPSLSFQEAAGHHHQEGHSETHGANRQQGPRLHPVQLTTTRHLCEALAGAGGAEVQPRTPAEDTFTSSASSLKALQQKAHS